MRGDNSLLEVRRLTNGEPEKDPFISHENVRHGVGSPDGEWVIAGDFDGTARIWNMRTGKQVDNVMKLDGMIRACAFSPDSKTVATGTMTGHFRLWETATGRPLCESTVQPGMSLHDPPIENVAFSSDGKLVVSGCCQAVQTWDAATGAPAGDPVSVQNQVHFVGFRPDEDAFYATDNHAVLYSWDRTTRQPKRPPTSMPGFFSSWVVFSPSFKLCEISPDDQTVITGCEDGAVQIWDVGTGYPLGPPELHGGRVNWVTYHPDGHTVYTASDDGTFRYWPLGEPVPGSPEQVEAWVKSITAAELNENGELAPLRHPQWQERKEQLAKLGGAPLP
jgi:WD40 repeat protein